jgi:endogenous inhibitor of DNA gyrase (YacG/DUF329 family)
MAKYCPICDSKLKWNKASDFLVCPDCGYDSLTSRYRPKPTPSAEQKEW